MLDNFIEDVQVDDAFADVQPRVDEEVFAAAEEEEVPQAAEEEEFPVFIDPALQNQVNGINETYKM